MREPAFWSNQWLRELPWRELIRRRRHIAKMDYVPIGIERSRIHRLELEYRRRKREGGGGLAARLARDPDALTEI